MLLDNAFKYTPEGGVVTLSACAEGDVVRVRVRDTGVGIPAADLPHVFDRFFTADKMRTGRNTGLGLAIVKALADQMGCGLEAGLDGAFFFVRIRWKL